MGNLQTGEPDGRTPDYRINIQNIAFSKKLNIQYFVEMALQIIIIAL